MKQTDLVNQIEYPYSQQAYTTESGGSFVHVVVDGESDSIITETLNGVDLSSINIGNGYFEIPYKMIQHLMSEGVKAWYNKSTEIRHGNLDDIKKDQAVKEVYVAQYAQFAFNTEDNDLEQKLANIFDCFDRLTRKGYLGLGTLLRCHMLRLATTSRGVHYVCFCFPFTTPTFEKAYQKAYRQLQKRKSNPLVRLKRSQFLNNVLRKKFFYEEGQSVNW